MGAPTLFAQGLTAAHATTVPSVVIPTHAADDILVVEATYWGPNTSAPGTDVALIPVPANWSDLIPQVRYPASPNSDGVHALLWRRAPSAGTTITLTRGAGWDTGTDTCYGARAYVIRGCITTGDPWDDAQSAGPYTGANGAFSALDVQGIQRLVVQFAGSNDNLAMAGPSIGWTSGTYDGDPAGTDCAFQTYRKPNEASDTPASATQITAPGTGCYVIFGVAFKPNATTNEPEGARAYHTAYQSVAENTWTPSAFDSEMFDFGSMHDPVTNNGRITITAPGFYFVAFHGAWSLGGNAGVVGIRVYKNGTLYFEDYEEKTQPAAYHWIHSAQFSDYFNLNDYLTVQVFQVGDAAGQIRSEYWNTPHFVVTLASHDPIVADVVEAASADTSQDATFGALSAAAVETAAATDLQDATGVYAAAAAENVAASDGPGALLVTLAARIEAASAGDTQDRNLLFAAAITEPGSATETQSALQAQAAAITEPGTAADTPSALKALASAITEAGSATDTPSGLAIRVASDTEAATATESPSALAVRIAAAAEAATATDTPSAVQARAASISEAGTATAVQDFLAGGGIDADLTEAASVTDSASALRLASAAVAEDATATDSAGALVFSTATVTEAVTASATQTAASIFPVSRIEQAAATDALVAQLFGNVSIVERASAFDMVGPPLPGSLVASLDIVMEGSMESDLEISPLEAEVVVGSLVAEVLGG